MRRPRTALACVMAVLVIALSASYLKAQMFGKRPPSPPPNPSSNPSPVPTAGYSPPATNRGARQLLRNGLDYLQTYQDPARAARYLEEANARRAELTPQEQASLDAALASVRTQVASQGSGSAPDAMAPLPPRPATSQVARTAPALPALPTLNPVPNPPYGPEPGVVLTSGDTQPPTGPEPLPEGEPIGLSVMSDAADQLVGLDSTEPITEPAQVEPLPACPPNRCPELQAEPCPPNRRPWNSRPNPSPPNHRPWNSRPNPSPPNHRPWNSRPNPSPLPRRLCLWTPPSRRPCPPCPARLWNRPSPRLWSPLRWRLRLPGTRRPRLQRASCRSCRPMPRWPSHRPCPLRLRQARSPGLCPRIRA